MKPSSKSSNLPRPRNADAGRMHTLAELARAFCTTEEELARDMRHATTGKAGDPMPGPFTEQQVQQLRLFKGI